ncbi:hypothetical protein GQ44DRAFT_621622 [Phaeosphaeriaceae sp. PMI808]|nr:hypothetical protein GQ44DRAFT_621622 [Phaeosphaeriaceae sp. PMI808]
MGRDSIIDPTARDKYLLHGFELVQCWLKVRIKDYHGLPFGSRSSSTYFDHDLHTSDRYSIAFSFVPKKDLHGDDVIMGFDYGHSIRHQLPPGFKYAMKIATSMLDPGLYSDPYSDNPYLYGPVLSSLFTFNIGERIDEISADEQLATLEQKTNGIVEEGAYGSGQSIREQQKLPTKWKKRRKHFLNPEILKAFTFEKGRMYHADFFNPHLDFANFSLRLPGFSISVVKYIDEKTHYLRFVLKNRRTDESLFVVIFKLLFGDELEKTLRHKKSEAAGEAERPVQNVHNEPPTFDDPKNTSKESATSPDACYPVAEKQFSTPDPLTENGEKVVRNNDNMATAAVTSLSNSIYAAVVSMGLWDESLSSSDSDAPKRSQSPQVSGQSLAAQVDGIDDATIEKYLQSRQSNV